VTRRYAFSTLDVFTDRVFGGNPLAVVHDAGELDPAQMQAIATEFNLSETVFVLPPETDAGTRRLRIFTPAAELPFAGHPTVGTAVLLATLGAVPPGDIVFEEGVGPVRVTLGERAKGLLFAQLSAAQLPVFGPPPPRPADLAAILGIAPADVLDAAGVSCGVPFLVVVVRDRDVLARVRVDLARWEALLAGAWASDLYVITPAEGDALRARMFAPGMGIAEDPATGAAASALAGYLARTAGRRDGTLRWTIAQGVEMGRPSRVELEADLGEGEITAVRVGGTAVRVADGEFRVP
jgi:trans-2,3-dihydro-3-hydroxyanthranilate isomerase